jgi:hypothetical protein
MLTTKTQAQAQGPTPLGELWWGYVHINMSLQVRRQISLSKFKTAEESDFILHVFQPFYATDRQDAINKLDHEYMAFLKNYQEM